MRVLFTSKFAVLNSMQDVLRNFHIEFTENISAINNNTFIYLLVILSRLENNFLLTKLFKSAGTLKNNLSYCSF